jgi:hypothetical protein
MNPVHPAFGSSTNITLHANPHTSQIFDSLKTYWIWPGLRDLDLSKQFLSRFLSLVDLGSFIDSKALADHVTRTPPVQLYRPSLFMRERMGGYAIAELVKFLRGTEYGSIHAGTMFTQYVVPVFIAPFLTSRNTTRFSSFILTKKIPVELTVLCRFLEIVAGSVIMARELKWDGLHGVTLPRSWILENVQKLHRVQNKEVNIRAVREIITPFRDLLERVYSGNDSNVGEPNKRRLPSSFSTRLDFLHQNKPLHSVPLRVRDFALARLYVLPAVGSRRTR